jgi:hypothetical protein
MQIQGRSPVRASLRPRSAGPVAQWESVRFTRGRSLVRSQPGPLSKGKFKAYICDRRSIEARNFRASIGPK